MSKIKKIFKWLLRGGLSALLVAFLVVAPFTIMPSLLSAQSNVNRIDDSGFKGILELWHIETFEGGGASRLSFLEKQAINFEKQNKGTYVVVSKMDAEQLNLNLQNGKLPNMVSFGIGVGEQLASHLVELDFATGIRTDILQGGKHNNKQLALPFVLGGYALVQNKSSTSKSVGTGFAGYNNSLKSIATNNIKIDLAGNINFDTYTAYDKFLKNNFGTLLGTQRDVFRVVNRLEKGLIDNIDFAFLGGYTDLVQYIGVAKSTAEQEQICKKFARSLVEQNTQQKLQSINMFSVLQNAKLYNQSHFEKFEEVLNEPLIVENVFLSTQKIVDEKQKTKKMVENE